MFDDITRNKRRHFGPIDSVAYRKYSNICLFNIESLTTAFAAASLDNLLIIRVGSVFQAPKSGTITELGYGLVSVTSPPTYEIRLETVTAATAARKYPIPSGTLWAANTNITFTPSGSNKFVWNTMTASASVTVGDKLGVSIKYSSGTFGESNYADFRVTGATHTTLYRGLPFGLYAEGDIL
jgi:hypothetical protein